MRPTAGVRYAIERAGEEGSATEYRGFAHLPDADLAVVVRVVVPEDGPEVRANVTAKIERSGEGRDAAELEKGIVALVKAAVRGARDAGRPLPRRIVRWRAGA
jgi:hypothetical protein